MSDVRIKRGRFLPYPYSRFGLTCELRKVDVDGHAADQGFDRDAHLIDLRGSWSVAKLTFALSCREGLLAELLPPDEHAAPPVVATLALRCGPTRLRRGVRTPLRGGAEALVVLEVERDELSGHAEIQPFLIRTADAAPDTSGFAATSGCRLASGRTWTLRVDLARPPTGRHLEIQYKHFSQDPAIPAAERKAMWRLDAAMESPVLWLNQDYSTIAEVLNHDGNRGRRAYLREVVFDRITSSVWPRLFVIAAESVIKTGEATYGWEESVLDQLLPDLYPSAPTQAGRIERLRQEFDELPGLLGRLDAVLQTRDDGVAHLIRLVEAK